MVVLVPRGVVALVWAAATVMIAVTMAAVIIKERQQLHAAQWALALTGAGLIQLVLALTWWRARTQLPTRAQLAARAAARQGPPAPAEGVAPAPRRP